MKDLIIIVGTLLLGCLIFNLIAADENSLKSAGSDMMKKTIEMYQDSDDL